MYFNTQLPDLLMGLASKKTIFIFKKIHELFCKKKKPIFLYLSLVILNYSYRSVRVEHSCTWYLRRRYLLGTYEYVEGTRYLGTRYRSVALLGTLITGTVALVLLLTFFCTSKNYIFAPAW